MYTLLALHIIFVVTWFAGLFYIPRLFIYHTEAQLKPEPEKTILSDQFKIMSRRLWFGITWPSAVLTLILGLSTAYRFNYFSYPVPGWLILKLALVFLLVLYHLQCGVIYNRLQKDQFKWSAQKLRFYNEVATILLFAIVFIVVFKDAGNYWWGLGGLLIFSLVLTIAILLYKKSRSKKSMQSEK